MIQDIILTMIQYFKTDVRRINHALKVYGFASAIAKSENLSAEMLEIVEVAAVLHDIGIPESEKKYNSSAGKYQEIEGPPIARKMLEALNVKPEIIDRVCFIIGNHHTYTKIDGVDFQILVEADFLVNIFEDEFTGSMIKSVGQKYFSTKTGLLYLQTMYANVADC